MLFRTPLNSLALALLLTPVVTPQAGARQEPPRGARQRASHSDATEKGLNLIEEIMAEARALQLPENRALVQAAAADMLWTHDEKSARALFAEALSNLDAIGGDVARDDPESLRLAQLAAELRRELLSKLARRDPSWARELTGGTLLPSAPVRDDAPADLSSVAEMLTPAPKDAPPGPVRGERDSDSPPEEGGPPEVSDDFYSEAAEEAQGEGDFARARQMASRITDQFQRGEALASVNRRYLLDAARAGRAEETLGSLALLRAPEERALMLAELAVAVARRDEKERARELAQQARNLVRERARNYAQLDARMRVASVLTTLDPEQSFEMIGTVISQLDELAAATAAVDGFITEEQFARNDELVLKQVLQFWEAAAGESAPDNGLAPLARREFDRLKSATDKFQRAELRVLAHLALAASVLARPESSARHQW